MGMSANCDKCGKWMTQKEFGRKGACLSLMYGFEYRTFTLCKGCRKAFEKWMGEYDHMANLREYAQDFGVTIEQAKEELRRE